MSDPTRTPAKLQEGFNRHLAALNKAQAGMERGELTIRHVLAMYMMIGLDLCSGAAYELDGPKLLDELMAAVYALKGEQDPLNPRTHASN